MDKARWQVILWSTHLQRAVMDSDGCFTTLSCCFLFMCGRGRAPKSNLYRIYFLILSEVQASTSSESASL